MGRLSFEGDFGKIAIGQSFDRGRVSDRWFEMDVNAALYFYRELAVKYPDLTNNSLGLYSNLDIGRNNEIKLTSFTTPAHLLSKRKNGCGWNPKGKMTNNIESYAPCPIQFQGELCPDVLWDSCMEKLLGRGNAVLDLKSTAESQRLLREILINIYRGLGNSLYELVWYGNHPLIDQASEQGTYLVEEDKWADYVDQQKSCTGFITLIDKLKEEGHENYNVIIEEDEIDESGAYIGEVGGKDGLFDRMLKKQTAAMRQASKYGATQAGIGRGIFLVSASIFEKYESEIYEKFPTLPATMQYYYTGEFCKSAGCSPLQPVRGVLNYKGSWVVCEDAWSIFDEMLNLKTHRALYLTPGILGLASDVSLGNQYEGLGMRMVQKLSAPDNGKIYMDTYLKLGMFILERDYLINASITTQNID
jgi:hypothetical protein